MTDRDPQEIWLEAWLSWKRLQAMLEIQKAYEKLHGVLLLERALSTTDPTPEPTDRSPPEE
jgi:hypothetical protein